MLKINKFPKIKKIASCLAIVSMSVTLFAQSAFALNTQGNATYMLRGCQYLDSNSVVVYFDKGTFGIPSNVLQIHEGLDGSGSAETISSISSYGTPYNVSVSGLAPGTAYQLDISGTFDPDTAYTITASNTIRANNGLTLGEVEQRVDSNVSFVVPDSGDYSGFTDYTSANEMLRVYVDDDQENVAREGNLWLSLAVPAAQPSNVLSGMNLERLDSGTWVQCTTDNPSYPQDPNAEIYQAVKTTQDNLFYFPLSIAGSSGQKDLKDDTEYRLTIPAIDLKDSVGTIPGQTIQFTTQSNVGPTKMNSTPTASYDQQNNDVDLSWTATSDLYVDTKFCNAAATAYNVYRSTNPYWDFTQLNSSPITGTSFTDDTPPTGDTVYYRITPIANDYEGGFSNYISVDTNP